MVLTAPPQGAGRGSGSHRRRPCCPRLRRHLAPDRLQARHRLRIHRLHGVTGSDRTRSEPVGTDGHVPDADAARHGDDGLAPPRLGPRRRRRRRLGESTGAGTTRRHLRRRDRGCDVQPGADRLPRWPSDL